MAARSAGLRNARLERKMRPGQPWLSTPGIWLRIRVEYGKGPARGAMKLMKRTQFCATSCAFRAGEGGARTGGAGGGDGTGAGNISGVGWGALARGKEC